MNYNFQIQISAIQKNKAKRKVLKSWHPKTSSHRTVLDTILLTILVIISQTQMEFKKKYIVFTSRIKNEKKWTCTYISFLVRKIEVLMLSVLMVAVTYFMFFIFQKQLMNQVIRLLFFFYELTSLFPNVKLTLCKFVRQIWKLLR